MVKVILILRLAFLLMFLTISSPRIFAQGGTPVFQRRYLPPAPEPPAREQIPDSEPIPEGWIFAGEAVLALGAVVILIAAARAWRESNIFGRQYRFPASESAARRFGGTRSGGLMAVIEPAKDKNA